VARLLNIDGVVITLMLGSFLVTALAGLVLLLLRAEFRSALRNGAFRHWRDGARRAARLARPGMPRPAGGSCASTSPCPGRTTARAPAAGQGQRAGPSLGLDRQCSSPSWPPTGPSPLPIGGDTLCPLRHGRRRLPYRAG
jgi:hypothetical protein